MSELAPGLLIAVPQMEDPNFARSVVLLVEHSAEGAMGIVFNRPSSLQLTEIGESHGISVPKSAGVAFVGGPVQRERGFLIHRREDVDEKVELASGVYLSVSTDSLKPIMEGDPAAYRLCLGYAGWGPGQLEKELMVGGWLTGAVTGGRLFDTPADEIWAASIRDLGVDPAFLVPSTGLQ